LGQRALETKRISSRPPKVLQKVLMCIISPLIFMPYPRASGYIKKFEKKYGTISGFGPPAYEAMNILLTAVNNAAKDGKISRKEVIQELHKIKNYRGILGFPITFNEKGDLKGGATYFFRVEGKDFKQVAIMGGGR